MSACAVAAAPVGSASWSDPTRPRITIRAMLPSITRSPRAGPVTPSSDVERLMPDRRAARITGPTSVMSSVSGPESTLRAGSSAAGHAIVP